jgi:hypothetical protein
MKYKTLLVSALLSLYIFVPDNAYKLGLCDVGDVACRYSYRIWGEAFLFFPLVFLFALITYFAPERVFQSWWRFARIGIPVAFASALVINLELLLSPGEQWGALFSIPALIIIYGAFTTASAWQIWKGWRAK